MMEITWKQMQRREARQRRVFWLRLALILALSMAILLALSLLCPPLAGGTTLAPIWTATPTVTPMATATPPMWLPSPLPMPTATPTVTPTIGKPPFYAYRVYLPLVYHAPDAWTSERGEQNGE